MPFSRRKRARLTLCSAIRRRPKGSMLISLQTFSGISIRPCREKDRHGDREGDVTHTKINKYTNCLGTKSSPGHYKLPYTGVVRKIHEAHKDVTGRSMGFRHSSHLFPSSCIPRTPTGHFLALLQAFIRGKLRIVVSVSEEFYRISWNCRIHSELQECGNLKERRCLFCRGGMK
jgi:hypothetical protein